jgi:hypothetical protein
LRALPLPERCLDIVPQRLVDNRRVFSGIGIEFVWYLAAVNTVLKDQIKRRKELRHGEGMAPLVRPFSMSDR